MKKVFALLGTLGLLVMVWAVWLIVSEVRDARVRRHLMSLKIGMSRAQVLAITGRPRGTNIYKLSSGERVESWRYPHKPGESEPPRCLFGGTNDTVIEVVCGDAYRIRAVDHPTNPLSFGSEASGTLLPVDHSP